MSSKKWFWGTVGGIVFLLAGIAFITVYIDPFFHYHKPIESMEYTLLRDNERYQNDGILYEYLLTQDNYEECVDEIREFYNSYDYSQIGRVW